MAAYRFTNLLGATYKGGSLELLGWELLVNVGFNTFDFFGGKMIELDEGFVRQAMFDYQVNLKMHHG